MERKNGKEWKEWNGNEWKGTERAGCMCVNECMNEYYVVKGLCFVMLGGKIFNYCFREGDGSCATCMAGEALIG